MDPRQGTNQPNFDLGKFLAFYKEMGAKGVGEVTANLYIDDPYMYNLFAACEKLELPLTFHIGTKGISYGMVDDIGLPRLEKALQDFPKLKFLGHSQLFWSEISGDNDEKTRDGYPTGPVAPGGRVEELMRKYPNLYGDMSAGSGLNAMTRDPKFTAWFMDKFQDQLMFGMDFCRLVPKENMTLSKLMDQLLAEGTITQQVYDKICWNNAAKNLGFKTVAELSK